MTAVLGGMLQGKDLSNAVAIQEVTKQLAVLVYGGRRAVKAKGWAPADAETIRCATRPKIFWIPMSSLKPSVHILGLQVAGER